MAQVKRNSFIDLWRFVSILMIMAHHQYRLGIQNPIGYFGWVFVEFFFILTGYLTANHFDTYACGNIEEMCKNAVFYTCRKFSSLIPLVWIAILLEYSGQFILQFINGVMPIHEAVNLLSNLPFEMMLIGSSYTAPVLVPLWYLSTMFLIFPLFCILLQSTEKYTRIVISLIVPLMFYGAFGVADNWLFPLNIGRAFSAMLLGVLAFELARILRGKTVKFWIKNTLTVLQMVCIAFPVIICCLDLQSLLRFVVLCFVVGITLSMSGKCYTVQVQSNALVYLGKISMPMYLFHWSVAGVVAAIPVPMPQGVRIAIYYLLSIFMAICIYEVYSRIKQYFGSKSLKNDTKPSIDGKL